jgi:hypothetical protein
MDRYKRFGETCCHHHHDITVNFQNDALNSDNQTLLVWDSLYAIKIMGPPILEKIIYAQLQFIKIISK